MKGKIFEDPFLKLKKSKCHNASSYLQDVDLNFWMGLADTISPLHTDPRENMFCQVRSFSS